MNCVTKKIQKNNKRIIKYDFLREPEHHTGLPAWQPNNFGSMPGSNKSLFCSGSCPEPLQNTTK